MSKNRFIGKDERFKIITKIAKPEINGHDIQFLKLVKESSLEEMFESLLIRSRGRYFTRDEVGIFCKKYKTWLRIYGYFNFFPADAVSVHCVTVINGNIKIFEKAVTEKPLYKAKYMHRFFRKIS